MPEIDEVQSRPFRFSLDTLIRTHVASNYNFDRVNSIVSSLTMLQGDGSRQLEALEVVFGGNFVDAGMKTKIIDALRSSDPHSQVFAANLLAKALRTLTTRASAEAFNDNLEGARTVRSILTSLLAVTQLRQHIEEVLEADIEIALRKNEKASALREAVDHLKKFKTTDLSVGPQTTERLTETREQILYWDSRLAVHATLNGDKLPLNSIIKSASVSGNPQRAFQTIIRAIEAGVRSACPDTYALFVQNVRTAVEKILQLNVDDVTFVHAKMLESHLDPENGPWQSAREAVEKAEGLSPGAARNALFEDASINRARIEYAYVESDPAKAHNAVSYIRRQLIENNASDSSIIEAAFLETMIAEYRKDELALLERKPPRLNPTRTTSLAKLDVRKALLQHFGNSSKTQSWIDSAISRAHQQADEQKFRKNINDTTSFAITIGPLFFPLGSPKGRPSMQFLSGQRLYLDTAAIPKGSAILVSKDGTTFREVAEGRGLEKAVRELSPPTTIRNSAALREARHLLSKQTPKDHLMMSVSKDRGSLLLRLEDRELIIERLQSETGVSMYRLQDSHKTSTAVVESSNPTSLRSGIEQYFRTSISEDAGRHLLEWTSKHTGLTSGGISSQSVTGTISAYGKATGLRKLILKQNDKLYDVSVEYASGKVENLGSSIPFAEITDLIIPRPSGGPIRMYNAFEYHRLASFMSKFQ